jgi:hypothetical protein
MPAEQMTITKLGGDEPPPNTRSLGGGDTRTMEGGIHNPYISTGGPDAFAALSGSSLVGGRRRRRHAAKSEKTFPRGILRKSGRTKKAPIVPSRNPTMGNHTRKVRMFTEKGLTKRHKRAHDKAAKKPIKEILAELVKRKIIGTNSKIPHKEARILYRDSVGAGLL